MSTLIPIGVVAFLAIWILQQDRDAERLRERDSLQLAAGQLALGIGRRLEDVEQRLARGEGIHFTSLGFESVSESALLYQPSPSRSESLHPSPFDEAEVAEYQGDLVRAATSYRRLAGSREPVIRAGALARLGGMLRTRGDREGALQAYDDLEQLGTVAVFGDPAALVAAQGRAKIFRDWLFRRTTC